MVPELIQGGLGIVNAVAGLINSGSAKQKAEELAKTRPKYNIDPNAQSAVDLAESELANGMSANAQNAYSQQTDRDLATSIDAILKGGGNTNSISDVFDRSQQGRLRLAQLQDNLRLNQINNLVSSQRYLGEQKDKAFEFNQWMPYADAAQANAKAREGSANQIWSGINTAATAGMNFFANKEQQGAFDNYFSTPASSFAASHTFTPNTTAAKTYNSPDIPLIPANAIMHGPSQDILRNYGVPNKNAANPEYNWGNFSNDLFSQYGG